MNSLFSKKIQCMHLIVNCPKEVTNGIAILLCQAIKMRIKTTRKSLTYLNNFLAYIKFNAIC